VKIFNTIIDALSMRLDEIGKTTEVLTGEDDDHVEEVELAAEEAAEGQVKRGNYVGYDRP
jgi:hypothetical protein